MNTAVNQVRSVAQDARPVYVLTGVSKSFPKRNIQALDRIDLTLREGSFSSVIGASGCGKSTLLKIMAGLIPPSSGRVVLQGKPVMGPREDIGMMFQQATLFPWRTVRSEEHTSELQSLMRNSYAVFCLKKKKTTV